MNALPVFKYGTDSSEDAVKMQSADTATPSSQQSARAAPPAVSEQAAARPPTGSRSSKKAPKAAVNPVDARNKAVYTAMESLLEFGANSNAEMLRTITCLSGPEFLLIAEERSLAGLCGNPRCANCLHQLQPAAHYKVDGRVVWDLQDQQHLTCSQQCQMVIDTIAQKLGNEDAALYRFTHPVQPEPPPTAPRPPPALSDTVIEHQPAPSSQNGPANSPSSARPPLHKQELPDAALQQPPLQGSGLLPTPPSEDGADRASMHPASHPPRKGSKAGPMYAAGSNKTPIMLAEIKEKDPSADEAFAAAKAMQRQSTAGDHVAATAVDGFVPKFKPKQLPARGLKPGSRSAAKAADKGAASQPSTAQSASQGTPQSAPRGTPQSAPQGGPQSAPRGRPQSAFQGNSQAGPQGNSQSAPQGNPQSAPEGTPQSAPQGTPQSTLQGMASERQLPAEVADGQQLQGQLRAHPASRASHTPATHTSSAGLQTHSETDKHLARLRCSAHSAATQSASSHSTQAQSMSALPGQTNADEHTAGLDAGLSSEAGSKDMDEQGTICEGASAAQQGPDSRPVLSFELEDAEGPLEGAEHGIHAKFGRLKVTDPAADREAAGAPAEVTRRSQPAHPSLADDYRETPPADQAKIPYPGGYSCDSSNGDESAQILTDDEEEDDDDTATWLQDPPLDFRAEMSPFGAIYTLLDTWPTQQTRDMLTSTNNVPSAQPQQLWGTSQEMLKTMIRILARIVPQLVRDMRVQVTRSALEQSLQQLLGSMHFVTPIPAIRVKLHYNPVAHRKVCCHPSCTTLCCQRLLLPALHLPFFAAAAEISQGFCQRQLCFKNEVRTCLVVTQHCLAHL